MTSASSKSYLFVSICAHIILFGLLIVSVHFSHPKPVFENTNEQDVISAVVLGDIAESKIIPQKQVSTSPVVKKTMKKIVKQPPKPVETMVKKKLKKPPVAIKKTNVIALKKAKPKKAKKVIKKKIAAKKVSKKVVTSGMIEKEKRKVRQRRKAKALAIKKKKLKEKKQKELASNFEKLLQAQAEQTMRQQMLEEDIRIKGERARRAQGIVDKYKALIIQAISSQWIVPTQSSRDLTSELMIRLSPGGMVLDVQVTQSSGDPALDSSARAAVLKASPLPVPKNPDAFNAFRRFVLKVKPENVL